MLGFLRLLGSWSMQQPPTPDHSQLAGPVEESWTIHKVLTQVCNIRNQDDAWKATFYNDASSLNIEGYPSFSDSNTSIFKKCRQ